MIALVAKAQAGDKKALDELLKKVQPVMDRYLRRFGLTEADRKDALQDALLTLVNNLKKYHGVSSFSSWFYMLTLNAMRMQKRTQRRHHRYVDDVELEDVSVAAELGVAPADIIGLKRAMQELDGEWLSLLTDRYCEEYGFEFISQSRNLTVHAARSKTERAKRRARALLEA